MIPCLDIHTHHPAPRPQAVVSSQIDGFTPWPGQLYSIGLHPWISDSVVSKEVWDEFDRLAALPCVVAIGECGIDKLKGGPLFKQLILFKHQIEVSEALQKPLIIHDVKAHDVIVGLKRDLNPSQKWLVHGFRGKPTVAKMLTDAGIYLSFGEKFNPESLPIVPPHMFLAETDESPLSINEIIVALANSLGQNLEEFTSRIQKNTSDFLNLNQNESIS